MSKLAFLYTAKGDTYIKIRVLHKAAKGHYANDIIELSYKSKTIDETRVMTPKEALMIANGLINAITMIHDKTGLLE